MRKDFDVQACTERVRTGPCFICEMLAGNNPHHIVYRDDSAVAFLNRYPSLYGYVVQSGGWDILTQCNPAVGTF